MGQGKGSKAVLSIHEARFEAGKPFRFIFKVAFEMHVQKRVLPLHPHLLNVVTSASLSSLAALLAMLQPAPSPLAHSRSSPAVMLGHSTQPCLPWQATRREGVVVRYSVSVLLKQIIAGIEMIIEIEERIELLQGSINRKY